MRPGGSPLFRFVTVWTVVPVLACAAGMSVFAASLLLWGSERVDRVAIERQQRLVHVVISQLRDSIAHNQESVTIWDDAVEGVRGEREANWVDNNLGTWMHEYFGHNGAFVLDPADMLVFAFSSDGDGKAVFAAMAGKVAPLVEEVRHKLASGNMDGVGGLILSPGAADLLVVKGHPAVVSVKPIISDTGDIKQTPGKEYLHVAVRYLDGEFLHQLERDYLFTGIRHSWQFDASEAESGLPLTSASGEAIGYFIWEPYKPGSSVLSRLAPVLVGTLCLILVAISTLLCVLVQRSKRLQASEAKMKYLALHDTLTGLPNRALFNERLDRALREAKQTRKGVAILYLDLDRFKQVNDTLGHPAGDLLIKEFGKRLCALTRDIDTVARIGGDEFIVILPRLDNVRSAEALCKRVIHSVHQPFDIRNNHIFVGVSIGVAVAPDHAMSRIELTRKADIALYHAKNSGRNGYAVFGPAMDMKIQERREIERDLRSALVRDCEFEVHYQPFYSAADERITGAEALVRWKHPTRGWISPSAFVPVAEETGLIEALGQRVLREACYAASEWPGLRLAVNVSAIELRNPLFVDRVTEVLQLYGLPPPNLEFEVTESALSGSSEMCERNVRALRNLGVSIALDDFGTGFSTFNRLQKLQVDRIKIDQSFVQGIGDSGGDDSIVQAIVSLAHARGLKTTAEGVETSEHSEFLKRVGCDELQGFLLSRPITMKQMDESFGVLRIRGPAKVTAA